MRTVTAEEAKASYERLCAWTEKVRNVKSSGETIGEWIYLPFKLDKLNTLPENETYEEIVSMVKDVNKIAYDSQECNLFDSLTPNAL